MMLRGQGDGYLVSLFFSLQNGAKYDIKILQGRKSGVLNENDYFSSVLF